MIRSLVRAIRRGGKARRDAALLDRISDRHLADLGLSRADIAFYTHVI